MSESKRRPQEKDVELLGKLSDFLRMEIHFEVYSPAMLKHPFFSHYAALNEQAMRKLCHRALKELHLSTDDVLFHSGETAKAMFFVRSGELEYRRPKFLTDTLEEGDWICEMVLWRPWEHHGTVKAVTESGLIELEATAFHSIVKETQTVHKVGEEDAIAYAFRATELLGEVEGDDLTDLDDVDIFTAADISREVFGEDQDHSGFAMKMIHGLEHGLERALPLHKFRRLSLEGDHAFQIGRVSNGCRVSHGSRVSHGVRGSHVSHGEDSNGFSHEGESVRRSVARRSLTARPADATLKKNSTTGKMSEWLGLQPSQPTKGASPESSASSADLQ
jgi:hypothetical protein